MKDKSKIRGLRKNQPREMNKFIIFSATLFLLIFVAGSGAFIFSMRQIIRENKGGELSQLLAIERVKLETSVNNDIVIALKMATSPLIQRYFANPKDEGLKKMAFEELADYRKAFTSKIIFWVNDIDKEFFYNDSAPYLLNPHSPDNYWYPMTLYETEVYNFNINYNPALNVTNLWINAPVFGADRRPLGMVGTGIDISTYLDTVNKDIGNRADIYFFNAAGEITGAKNVKLVAARKNIETLLGPAGNGIVALARGLEPGETRTLDTPLGRIALGTLPLLEWHSVAIMPDGMDDYNSPLTALFMVMLLAIAVIIVVFNVFIAGLLKPLRKAMVEAEEANRAKSEFLAIMSHEIRTPMNSVMGFAELALDRAFEPQIKDYLDKIASNAKWLLNIINDILDISKIESGKMELENAPFSLDDVIAHCQSVILPSVKEKNIEVRFYAEPLPGKRLMGDSVRLYQVFMNLLSNAVKFTDSGTVDFSSSIKASNNGRATIHFEVRDSGIGMTPEQIEKIFKPFVQADSSTTRNYGGTGLGLTITANLVELMGGRLEAKSAPVVGSVFSFELAFETIDAPDNMPAHTKISLLEKPRFEGLVLVCDDNPMNLELICEHLRRVGLRAVVAYNGKAGMEIVEDRLRKAEKPFDLIFMDMLMPVMDGMEAASKIREFCAETPIVPMTANVMAGELEKYKRNGMPDCLGKPFTSEELWRILLKYLTPTGGAPMDEYGQSNDELQRRLRINFIKNNQAKYSEITEAIESGDIKLAHRLAHTLKGSAGLIGKDKLGSAAAEVEALLSQDEILPIPPGHMNLLKTELESVLEELRPLFDEPREITRHLSAEQIAALFERLEPMLENINPQSLTLIDEVRSVPGALKLAYQIENYEFEAALETLQELKKNLA